MEMLYPEHLREVTLDNYMGFLIHAEKVGDPAYNQISAICQCVGAFYGVEMEQVLQVEIGDLYEKLPIKEARKQEHGLRGQLSSLYGHAIKVLEEYVPAYVETETWFTYKGEQYRIPPIMKQALAGEMLLPNLSTIEVVEAAEVQRFTSQQLESKEGKAKSHSLVFSMYLRMLAILCRKEGEHLPIENTERWINDRAKHFEEMDAATARDIDFFLHNILPSSESDGIQNGFLTRRSFVLAAETRLRKEKPSPVSSRTTRKFFAARAGGR